MSTIVRVVGTGLMRVTITEGEGGGYTWSRTAGPYRDWPIRGADPALLDLIATTAWDEVALRVPEHLDSGRATYRAALPYSTANLLHGRVPSAADAERMIADTLAHTGAALARLHTLAPPAPDLPGPEFTHRLLPWLNAGTGTGAAPRLYEHLVPILGKERLAAVTDWCLHPGGSRRLLHGSPGSGFLIPPADSHDGVLLTGEEIAAGPPEHDLGWLAGELFEMRDSPAARRIGPAVDHELLVGCLLAGYTGPLDPAAVGRSAALRVLTHAHDIAAYVGWHDFAPDHLRMVARLIDQADAGALIGAAA